ncbi:OmpA family protein [Tateyamaria armeniaca]|uniref:OmpA family protein n=1 Tax=Tateyamaria armeniaca TaxID=2518930 RepID=A0ABW8US65_9RHOB
MKFSSIRDSLPWLVPAAAIVFAGSGYLKSVSDIPVSAQPDRDTVSAPAPEEQIEQLQAALNAALQSDGEEEIVARQDTGADALVDLPKPEARAKSDVAVVEPAPEPVAPTPVDDRVAALTIPHSAAKLFESGEAAAEDAARCMDDLRNLTSQAVVYFPSGGVTADDGGVEQGRLIGLVAQSCDGVRIKVEGHSDASGDPVSNQRLSERRAEQVIQRIAASGIDTSMFFAEGAGDREPSGVIGPQPRAYYDRRVEFSVVDGVTQVAVRTPGVEKPWANASCVTELERITSATSLFYAPRSVSLPSQDLETAFELASLAMECPHARLRVVGHHSADVQDREDVRTGLLRAKALMAMLVGRGVSPNQIIIAAHSRPLDDAGLPGSRVNFDVLLEEK